MDSCHQAFFQWMLTERLVPENELKCAIRSLLNKECGQQEMFDFILPVQQALRPFELDLMRVYYLATDEYIWGVVNTNGDSIAQAATSYTPNDIAAYKRILAALSDAPLHEAKTLQLALKVQKSESSNYTASKAEELIESFIADFWLHRIEPSRMITVGPKAVLELKAYLSEHNLFEECSFCKNMIVNGKTVYCSKVASEECDSHIHHRCAEKISSCPKCQSALMADEDQAEEHEEQHEEG